MGLLKKKKNKKKMRMGGAAASQQSTQRPVQLEKLAPCVANCPSGTDIRGWMTIIAEREKTGLSEEEAYTKAWLRLVETNPFPSMMGRVCPHPCEEHCSRAAKDGSVAINAVEKYIGDWALEKGLALPVLEEDEKPESVGVIGAGPAGLSFAYQMARRGYKVTVYEKSPNPGGMVYWGIPFYRQPEANLKAEVQRIADLGVDIRYGTTVGKDISVADFRAKHDVVFIGIGAHKGRLLRCPGEDGPGVLTGTAYLAKVNAGETVDVGQKVAVIGGGDTAIDAARAARRAGAEVTILYRRTRTEMPAIDSEIEDAFKEDVTLELLRLPVEIKRDGDGKVVAVVVQKMELGEPDKSGRRRPVPVEGTEYELPIDTVIAAISQQADWEHLQGLAPEGHWWLEPDEHGKVADGVWAGGDVVNLALATTAIGQARQAAIAADAELRGREMQLERRPLVIPERLKLEFYDAKDKGERAHRPVEEWLSKPDEEIDLGFTAAQFVEELSRCFSCGHCFGCERCWMYCTPGCFKKVEDPAPGHYYKADLATCDGCKKCQEECPCGYIDMQ